MRIAHLKIQNFRGIKELDWPITGRMCCLIGPGDSRKTTILDAIELALLPRWNFTPSDLDFHNADISAPIAIEVTVSELPKIVLREDRLGMSLRGWSEAEGVVDEPGEGTEPAVTIRLYIDSSLEPTWKIINDRIPDGHTIFAKDRDAMGVSRLGPDIDRHLSWMKGSALARMTDELERIPKTIADAVRAAREAVKASTLPPSFPKAAKEAHAAAKAMGARPQSDSYDVAMGTALGVSVGALELHDGVIPVRSSGLGSRRLATLGIQMQSIPEGAILLVDEVELGLEPHRLAHVLSVLESNATSPTPTDGACPPSPSTPRGQVFLTTHSSVALRELNAPDLCLVTTAGATTVRSVPPDLQDLVRAAPEALLATRVLLCEGKTEAGVCRSLIPTWEAAHGGVPFMHTGSVVVSSFSGGGSKAPGYAHKLAELGYPTALLADSDQSLSPSADDLKAAGVRVIQWANSACVETRVLMDLPWPFVQRVLDLAVEFLDKETVTGHLRATIEKDKSGLPLPSLSVNDWASAGIDEASARSLIARTAKKRGNGWYKSIERGERLGMLLAAALPSIPETDLARKLREAGTWCYAK